MLKSASSLISEIRDQHEGLSGHIYVDAAVYASQRGVEGCENGAAKHRGDSISIVLAMDRCATCVLASGGKCQKYNKRLASKIPEKAILKQREMLAQVDLEKTVPVYRNDFQLEANTEFELDPEVVKQPVGEIKFGGMTL